MLNIGTFFPLGWREDQFLLGCGYFLYGARSSGKSSLAFQAAVNTVQRGGTVLVLCHEQCLSHKVPQPFTSLATLSEEELNRLEFGYVNDWESAIKELLDMDDGASEDGSCIADMIILEDEGWNSFPSAGSPRGGRSSGRPHSRGVLNSDSGRYFRGVLDSQRATCLSILVLLRNRMMQSGRNLTFIVVSNNYSAIEYSGLENTLDLPLSNFPLVQLQFSPSGMVNVIPLPSDGKAFLSSFSLQWKDGLQLG